MAVGFDSGKLFDPNLEEVEVEMESGDSVLLFTDGVNEAMNTHREQYGFDRLRRSFLKYSPGTATEIVDGIHRDVSMFTGNAEQNDDIAMVVVRRKQQ